MAALLIPGLFLQMIPLILFSMVPNGRALLKEFLNTTNWTQVFLIVIAILVVATLGVFQSALARFQRARLILD